MNTKEIAFFGAALVATLAATQNVRASNLAHAATLASAATHRLIVASPHALEEFPWLLRESLPQSASATRSETALSVVKKNSAFAASPRVREQYPELDRSGWLETASAKTATDERILPSVLKNRAWAASPRVKEEYPWLARGYSAPPTDNPVQIAPVK